MGWFDEQGIPQGGAIVPMGNEPQFHTQAFVYGPDGSYKTSGDPNGQWYDGGGNPIASPGGWGTPPPNAGGAPGTRTPVVDPRTGTSSLPTSDFRTGGGGQQPYSDAALQAILQKYPPTNDGVRQAYAEIQQTFGPNVVQLLDHPERLDKFVTPTGTYDTVIGAGGANPSWGWQREGAHGGGGGGTLGSLSGVGISPEGRAFADMVMRDAGRVGPLLGDPMAGKPITDDPSYQFRLGEGVKALERSAASKGTLLTGGTAKALTRYAQDVASTEYQNSYARRANEQGNNYSRLMGLANFMSGEQQNQFGRLYQTAGLGLNATNNQQQLASGYAGGIGNAQLQQGNAQAAGTAGSANAWAGTIGTLGQYGSQYYSR